MAIMKGRCQPAYAVICRLGGVSRVAQILDITQSAVSRWIITRSKGGTDGRIPPKYWEDILGHAKKAGIKLDVFDLSGLPRG